MTTEYKKARPEIAAVASELIDAYHQHLRTAHILYLERSGTWKSKGGVIGGNAALASSQVSAIAEKEITFIVTVNGPLWDAMPPEQQKALMDHELCHCVGEPGKWGIRGHDVEEFAEVIQRHGIWEGDLERFFGQIGEQLDLFNARPEEARAESAAARH